MKRKTSKEPAVKKKTVSFEYFDPAATIVTLAGNFNGWDPQARPLKRDAGGLWKGTVRLAPGTYEYKFVVNGERWEVDPVNPEQVPNEHGSFNSVRVVPSSRPADEG